MQNAKCKVKMQNNVISHPQFTREGKKVAFTPEVLEKVHCLMERYPEGRQKSALLPVLHIAQEELGGYLSVDIMDYVASLLDDIICFCQIGDLSGFYLILIVKRHFVKISFNMSSN